MATPIWDIAVLMCSRCGISRVQPFGRGVDDGLVSLGSTYDGKWALLSTQTYVQALFSARDTKTAVAGRQAAAPDSNLLQIAVSNGSAFTPAPSGDEIIDALPLYPLPICRNASDIGLGAVLLSALGSIAKGLALAEVR